MIFRLFFLSILIENLHDLQIMYFDTIKLYIVFLKKIYKG
jgi:hypothetical protein